MTTSIGVRAEGQTEEIRKYIRELLRAEKELGRESVDLISGIIHKDLELKNRMPSVCDAMNSLHEYRKEILIHTPSGRSSTIKIRYFLKD